MKSSIVPAVTEMVSLIVSPSGMVAFTDARWPVVTICSLPRPALSTTGP